MNDWMEQLRAVDHSSVRLRVGDGAEARQSGERDLPLSRDGARARIARVAVPKLPTSEALPERYKALRRLGEGGTAEVILVEDSVAPSPKVLKVLRPKLAPVLVASFRDEFRIL